MLHTSEISAVVDTAIEAAVADGGPTVAMLEYGPAPVRVVMVPKRLLDIHQRFPEETESQLWHRVKYAGSAESAIAGVYLVALIESPTVAAIIAGGRLGRGTSEAGEQGKPALTEDPKVP